MGSQARSSRLLMKCTTNMDPPQSLELRHIARSACLVSAKTLKPEVVTATLGKYADAEGRPRLRVIIQTSTRVRAVTFKPVQMVKQPAARGETHTVYPPGIATWQRTSAKFGKPEYLVLSTGRCGRGAHTHLDQF
jgi:hypothetical protein